MSKPRLRTPAWKYRDLLHVLGSPPAIQRLLAAEGYTPPPEDTVAGWKQRNSVPGKWAPIVIQMGLRRGFIRNIDDLKAQPEKRKAP